MDFKSQSQLIHFQSRLEETQAWCASQDWSIDLAKGGLRTTLLRPLEKASVWNTFPMSEQFWNMTPQQWQQLVEDLALKRVTLLHEQRLPSLPLAKGRLLVFNPSGSASDGAALPASKHFFDNDNMPAWDTWIAYVTEDPVLNDPQYVVTFDSYLLSWVPEPFVEQVDNGIVVNPEGCILWATDLDTVFIQQLREAGLLC